MGLDNDEPFVTVGIPTRNRHDLLRECLLSVIRQDYPQDRYEIIVADDGSHDGTVGVVNTLQERYPRPTINYLYQEQAGSNAARNQVLRHAKGDPICFVDDDELAPHEWLSSMVAGAARFPDAGCLGGPIRLRCEGPAPRSCGAEPLGEGELELGDRPIEAEYIWSGNMALKRAAVDIIGLFREDLETEVELLERMHEAEIPVMYLPAPPILHLRSRDQLRLHRLMTRRFARGRSQAIDSYKRGRPYDAPVLGKVLIEAVMHASTQRCSIGLIQAAQHAGRLFGMGEWRVKKKIRAIR